jgi:hypothetical protein
MEKGWEIKQMKKIGIKSKTDKDKRKMREETIIRKNSKHK